MLNETYFYELGLLTSRPTPTWRTRVHLFACVKTYDLSGMGGPTSSYTSAGNSYQD
jgi:hypothetical protein